jgi:hypothetical protein
VLRQVNQVNVSESQSDSLLWACCLVLKDRVRTGGSAL